LKDYFLSYSNTINENGYLSIELKLSSILLIFITITYLYSELNKYG